MIEVKLPDGTMVEFPDGTSQEVMRNALRRRFGGSQTQADLTSQPAPVPRARVVLSAGPEPGFLDHVRDGANAIGLPGDRIRRDLRSVGAFAGSAVNQALLGFGDEVEALGETVTGKGSFSENLERREKIRDQEEVRHPTASLAGGVIGALASGGALTKAGVTTIKNANTFPKLVAAGLFDGAILGGISGAGNASGDLKDRKEGAKSGALTGASVGAVVPVALAGGGIAGRAVRNRFSSNVGTPQSQAEGRVRSAFDQAGVTADDALAKLDDLGEEGAIIDVLGEPGRALARSAANTNPVARETLENFSTERLAGQPYRLTDSLLRASGLDEPRTIYELQKAARNKAQPQIYRAYEEARSLGYDIDPKFFDDLTPSEIFRDASRTGKKLAREQAILDAAKRGVPVDKHVVENGPSNLAIFDKTQRALDDIGQAGLSKRPTGDQEIAGDFAKVVRDRIDEFLPEYGGARALAQNLRRQEEAIKLGALGASNKVPSDFKRMVQALPPEYRRDVAQGYASAKIDQINDLRGTSELPKLVDDLFGPRRQRQSLGSSLGDGASYVRSQIANERAFSQADRSLRENGITARQLSELGRTGAASAAGGFGGFAYGGDAGSAGIGAVAMALARRGGGAAIRHFITQNEKRVAPIVADILRGRQVPQSITKNATSSVNAARKSALSRALVRALSIQSGGQAGALATGP